MKPETVLEAARRRDLETVKRYFEQEDTADRVEKEIALIAAENNDLDTLRYVSNKNPSIVRKNGDPDYDVLRRAVSSGAFDVVKYLVEEHDADILHENTSNKCQNDGSPTALTVAMKKGHFDILKYFLEDRNLDVNTPLDHDNRTVLCSVVDHHMEDRILKYIVENKNGNLTMLDSNGEHILYAAARRNNLEFMKYVLDERKAKIDIDWRNSRGETLVHKIACSYMYPDPEPYSTIPLLEYLVNEKKANVNIQDEGGNAPLHCAQSNDACEFLVEHGALVNQENSRGETPLHCAFLSADSNEELFDRLKCLVLHGADVNSRNARSGKTPLILATGRATVLEDEGWLSVSICKFLLEHGADINLADNFGNTPLRYAVLGLKTGEEYIPYTHDELFRYYLELGADVNRGNKDGDTPLHWAARYSTRRVCQQLVDHGAKVDQRNKKGETAVYVAVVGRQTEILKYLVGEKRADLNIPTLENKTSPLHFAASANDYDLCRYLVENGAQTQVQDKDGRTPVQRASNKCVIDYLNKRSRRDVALPWTGLLPLLVLHELDAIAAKASVGTNHSIEGPLSTLAVDSAHVSNIQGFLALISTLIIRSKTLVRFQPHHREPRSFQRDALDRKMGSFFDLVINKLRNDNVI